MKVTVIPMANGTKSLLGFSMAFPYSRRLHLKINVTLKIKAKSTKFVFYCHRMK